METLSRNNKFHKQQKLVDRTVIYFLCNIIMNRVLIWDTSFLCSEIWKESPTRKQPYAGRTERVRMGCSESYLDAKKIKEMF